MNGMGAVFRKEARQMRRDPGTLRFAIAIPVFQLILFGMIDTNVRRVPTVVLDHSRTEESRQLLREFENTNIFRITRMAATRDDLRETVVAGRASVAIEIPPDFGRRVVDGREAQVQVLIDGSDSSISSQALSAANGLALSRSLETLQARTPSAGLPLQVFPQLLFNPDSRSANLLLPGLVAILLMFSATMLSCFSIVRERERGTLEQLLVTPVSPIGLLLGKLTPYLVLGGFQSVLIVALMNLAFRVPIRGDLVLLMVLSLVYLFALLALGLLVSARAKTQMEALLGVQAFLLPSIFLSGYMFPMSSLPTWLQVVGNLFPATHFIAISRGVVLRGAGLGDLWMNVAALVALSTVLVLGSLKAFQKTAA